MKRGCLSAVILGASGFAGAELLRLLTNHSGIEVAAAAAGTQTGRLISDAYPNLQEYKDVAFTSIQEALSLDPDIVFSSLPYGESMRLFAGGGVAKVVDISGDFRLKDPALYSAWYGEEHSQPAALNEWVYGLTEFHRAEITKADRVANPGCYPAAAILSLGPLLEAGAVKPEQVHIDAKSGVSGAGRAGGEGFDFASVNENTRAYSVTGHKHIPEIEQELSLLAGSEVTVSFVPHLVPMTRGIVATCVAELTSSSDTSELVEILRTRYQDEPFVQVLSDDSLPETKRLAGTNLAEVTVRVDQRTRRAISISAIDNLGKGAAGQALQNANLMLGFRESEALETGGVLP